jgi:acetoin utilization deacetylase AcuC-like enzyme
MRETARSSKNNMTTAIYSHPDCQRHDMGDWHPESPARLQAIADQLIGSHIGDLLEHREAPLVDMSDLERNHSKNAIGIVRDNVRPRATPTRSMATPRSTPGAGAPRSAPPAPPWPPPTPSSTAKSTTPSAPCARPATTRGRKSRWASACSTTSPSPPSMRWTCAAEAGGVVDFDVHHGNGTEEASRRAARADGQLLPAPAVSHRAAADHRPLVNVPVPAHTKGDVVRKIVTEQWLPALHAFKPEMIFISAGFDAHREDDIGGMGLVEADYAWITQQMMAVARQYAQGRIVSCLEGGYNLSRWRAAWWPT